jgi:glycosyltransferase involved in cell wall biosynthesis
MPNPKVLLVANTSWYLYNFRLPLMRDLRDAGYLVAAVAPHDTYTNLLRTEGFTVYQWQIARRSINPLRELYALVHLIRIYQREHPELVHHFTIKACLYGTIAAKLSGVTHVINAITGLGHIFVGAGKTSNLLRLALKPIYKLIFRSRRAMIIFQNADDQSHLSHLGIVDSRRTKLIRSSGVDVNYFNPSSIIGDIRRNQDIACPISFHSPVRLLFPSRLIAEKGINELLTACRNLWKQGANLELLIAGAIDEGNRSSLTTDELAELRADPRIHCLGHVSDMRNIYAKCDLVVLPSWREGLSRALIEAAAMECPIITTNVPGCRDVVDHGRNGLLVPPHDAIALQLAITLLIEQPDLAFRFGREARRKVVSEFQVSVVNEHTMNIYRSLLPITSGVIPASKDYLTSSVTTT